MFDIAVILINYNSSRLTIECIASVVQKTPAKLNYQIVVVDNCSKDEDYHALQLGLKTIDFENLKLVRSRINTGFGGGNMTGVHYADAKYYAFINNDTVFKNDCLSILKNAMDTNASYGITGPQAYTGEDKFMVSLDHFSSPARELFGRNVLEAINPKMYPKRKKTYTSPVKVNYIPGSFMFVRAADFNAVGGFDTNIFLYYEETDLCKRLNAKGKAAYLIPEAEFIHYHGGSTEKSLAIKKELKISALYVMGKHYGASGRFIVHIYLIIKYFFSSLAKPRYWSLFWLLLKGAPLSSSLKLKQVIAEK
ncbi:glycosyltransferase family 2 protein [Flavobacterium psychrotrophum]|uniref:glycosyltransferase family 2 protein n=1 Tax=Flavobacterium psychrotrophum TaxID=2294119 RepID=UPI000E317BD0|nr:glycosyltransferase family 2 protein [Flavobacterium psychrotrophum]